MKLEEIGNAEVQRGAESERDRERERGGREGGREEGMEEGMEGVWLVNYAIIYYLITTVLNWVCS